MRSSVNSRARCGLPRWQVCLSVLLILLVVYNPFSALSGYSSGVSYDKLARNRATIGSSELQHFSPVSNSGLHGDQDFALLTTELLRYGSETERFTDQREALPSQSAKLAGFWFRPPPSR
jgi:hypothetical protein